MPVTGLDIALRRPLGNGASFTGPNGEVGPYEELKGRLQFAVDPGHAANRRITDVELAPRNARGLTEWSADVSILLPVDRARCSGRVLLDVVNRGNTVAVPNSNGPTGPVSVPGRNPDLPVAAANGFWRKRGWVGSSCDWQGDVPAIPGLFRMQAPIARDHDGRALRGVVHSLLQSTAPVGQFLLSARGHIPYPAADLDERGAQRTVLDQPDGPAMTVPRARWRFARLEGGLNIPDAPHIHLEGGFEKGRLYQITYTAEGAPVLGLSMAALRDSVSWPKHGSSGNGHPAPGALR